MCIVSVFVLMLEWEWGWRGAKGQRAEACSTSGGKPYCEEEEVLVLEEERRRWDSFSKTSIRRVCYAKRVRETSTINAREEKRTRNAPQSHSHPRTACSSRP